MDSYSKPILILEQNRDDPSTNVLMICGGSGVFHLQFADQKAFWYQASDPNGSDDEIEVWTSDQGFAIARKNTWPLEIAVSIAQYYFDHGTAHPQFAWS